MRSFEIHPACRSRLVLICWRNNPLRRWCALDNFFGVVGQRREDRAFVHNGRSFACAETKHVKEEFQGVEEAIK